MVILGSHLLNGKNYSHEQVPRTSTCPNTSSATTVQSLHIQPLILPKERVNASFKYSSETKEHVFPSIADSH